MSGFPDIAVAYTAERLQQLVGVSGVEKRPLVAIDPSGSVGVFAVTWTPQESLIGQRDPAIQQWLFSIQAFVTHGDAETGLQEHGDLARSVRHMLYRDQTFRVGLTSLVDSTMGYIEKVTRWGVRQQRFISNEVQSDYLYLTVTEFWLDTESIGL